MAAYTESGVLIRWKGILMSRAVRFWTSCITFDLMGAIKVLDFNYKYSISVGTVTDC